MPSSEAHSDVEGESVVEIIAEARTVADKLTVTAYSVRLKMIGSICLLATLLGGVLLLGAVSLGMLHQTLMSDRVFSDFATMAITLSLVAVGLLVYLLHTLSLASLQIRLIKERIDMAMKDAIAEMSSETTSAQGVQGI